MGNKKIRITFLDILIYLTLTFFCMQFCVNTYSIPFFVFIDSLGIKHILLVLTIAVGFVSDLRRGRLKIREFTYEIKMVMAATVSLLLISFVYMAFNGIADYWVSQVYFILAPLFFAYTVFKNDWSAERFKRIVNFLLFIGSVYYSIYIIARLFSGEELLEFSYLNSSAPFENEAAHFYIFLYIFYTFNGDYKRRAVSAFFCILAWKRLCIIYLIFITIVGFMRTRNKRIKIGYMVAIALVFTVIGVLMQYTVSESFGRWFNDFTGLNFIEFSNFRYYTIRTALSGELVSRGLGSFFIVQVPWYGHIVDISIHNDLLRLYLEVSAVGLFLYLMFTAVIAKRKFSMFVIVYLYIEFAGSHLMGNGGIPFWFAAYTAIFYFNRYERDGFGNIYYIEDKENGAKRLKRHISVKNGNIKLRK